MCLYYVQRRRSQLGTKTRYQGQYQRTLGLQWSRPFFRAVLSDLQRLHEALGTAAHRFAWLDFLSSILSTVQCTLGAPMTQ